MKTFFTAVGLSILIMALLIGLCAGFYCIATRHPWMIVVLIFGGMFALLVHMVYDDLKD